MSRESLAAAGVILSLGFVAFEVRQNTRAVRSQTLQAIAEQAAELSLVGVESPELRTAFQKGWSGTPLTSNEATALGWFYAATMRVTENRFRQFQLGILDESTLQEIGGHAPAFRNPFFKEWWPTRRFQFSPDFVEYVESALLTLEVAEMPLVGLESDSVPDE